jgi:hypothetical protein
MHDLHVSFMSARIASQATQRLARAFAFARQSLDANTAKQNVKLEVVVHD